MLKFLDGYKVHFGAIGWGLLGIAYAQGWLDTTMAGTIGAILTAWTGVALRSAWAKGK